MKILFVCAGGLSTGLIVDKMKKWAKENNLDLELKECGILKYERYWKDYDCILVGPQVRYAIPNIKKNVTIPVATIDPKDYGMQKVENMLKLAKDILNY